MLRCVYVLRMTGYHGHGSVSTMGIYFLYPLWDRIGLTEIKIVEIFLHKITAQYRADFLPSATKSTDETLRKS